MKNKFHILTVLFSILFSSPGFAQLNILIDNIEVKNTFQCFNYPNEILLKYDGFDSLAFDKSYITYFDLNTEEMKTVKFDKGLIDINPSCKLSAHYASRKNPISIRIKKAYGYINGEKIILKNIDKNIDIKLVSVNLLEEYEYARINGRSKLRLLINDEIVSSNRITLDSVSQLSLRHLNDLEFYQGKTIIALLSEKGTARPIISLKFTDIDDLNKQLKDRFHQLDKESLYHINFSAYYDDSNNLTRKIESMAYLLKIK